MFGRLSLGPLILPARASSLIPHTLLSFTESHLLKNKLIYFSSVQMSPVGLLIITNY